MEENDNNLHQFDEFTWIIDPVDGTTNILYDYKQSAISLALFIKSIPTLGIVYNPFSKELYKGIRNEGAYLNDDSIKVTDNNTLKQGQKHKLSMTCT